jgi:hypothetical protein
MMLWLPDAKRVQHDRYNSWSERTDPKGCLHTTEGSGWPGYDGWTIFPHATVMPSPGKGVDVHQHLPFDQGSFALRNLSGGVETNRDYVFQFELIGTCVRGGPGYYWPGADDAVLRDLYRKVIGPLSEAYGIPLRAQPFQSYPDAYGARGVTNDVRMSGSAFDNWSGWLGHQHVPENVHGDPGAFPWARMMALIQEENDVDKSDVKAAVLEVLRDRSLIENTTQDGSPSGTMSVLDALRLGDFKADRENDQNKDETSRDAIVAAKLDALQTAVDGLIARLDTLPAK